MTQNTAENIVTQELEKVPECEGEFRRFGKTAAEINADMVDRHCAQPDGFEDELSDDVKWIARASDCKDIKKSKRYLFKLLNKGPQRMFSLLDMLQVFVLPSTFIFRKLLPPMTVEDGSLFCDDVLMVKANLVVPEIAPLLAVIADMFECEISISSPNCNKVWTSKDPLNWYGYCFEHKSPYPISELLCLFSAVSSQQKETWMKERGIVLDKKEKKDPGRPRRQTPPQRIPAAVIRKAVKKTKKAKAKLRVKGRK
jgi:hypothetical protein